jgi:hypothetical protein
MATLSELQVLLTKINEFIEELQQKRILERHRAIEESKKLIFNV